MFANSPGLPQETRLCVRRGPLSFTPAVRRKTGCLVNWFAGRSSRGYVAPGSFLLRQLDIVTTGAARRQNVTVICNTHVTVSVCNADRTNCRVIPVPSVPVGSVVRRRGCRQATNGSPSLNSAGRPMRVKAGVLPLALRAILSLHNRKELRSHGSDVMIKQGHAQGPQN